MLPAQFYVSKPGRLPCKAIIHAVGPIWSSGHGSEKNSLYETVVNILEEAERRMFTSVALPTISAGIYQFPLQLATATILEAVRDFLKQPMPPQKLHEVHIIDRSLDAVLQFCATAVVVFGDVDNVHVSDGSGSSNTSRLSSQTSRPSQYTRRARFNINTIMLLSVCFYVHLTFEMVHQQLYQIFSLPVAYISPWLHGNG